MNASQLTAVTVQAVFSSEWFERIFAEDDEPEPECEPDPPQLAYPELEVDDPYNAVDYVPDPFPPMAQASLFGGVNCGACSMDARDVAIWHRVCVMAWNYEMDSDGGEAEAAMMGSL